MVHLLNAGGQVIIHPGRNLYVCPHCGGEAHNGPPDDPRTAFRGGGKCKDCGKGFSIAGSDMNPVGKLTAAEWEERVSKASPFTIERVVEINPRHWNDFQTEAIDMGVKVYPKEGKGDVMPVVLTGKKENLDRLMTRYAYWGKSKSVGGQVTWTSGNTRLVGTVEQVDDSFAVVLVTDATPPHNRERITPGKRIVVELSRLAGSKSKSSPFTVTSGLSPVDRTGIRWYVEGPAGTTPIRFDDEVTARAAADELNGGVTADDWDEVSKDRKRWLNLNDAKTALRNLGLSESSIKTILGRGSQARDVPRHELEIILRERGDEKLLDATDKLIRDLLAWKSKGIADVGRWIAQKWTDLETRYGRKTALLMAIALVAPGSMFTVPALIAAAETARGIQVTGSEDMATKTTKSQRTVNLPEYPGYPIVLTQKSNGQWYYRVLNYDESNAGPFNGQDEAMSDAKKRLNRFMATKTTKRNGQVHKATVVSGKDVPGADASAWYVRSNTGKIVDGPYKTERLAINAGKMWERGFGPGGEPKTDDTKPNGKQVDRWSVTDKDGAVVSTHDKRMEARVKAKTLGDGHEVVKAVEVVPVVKKANLVNKSSSSGRLLSKDDDVYTFAVSTEAPDRDGDTIDQESLDWSSFDTNPVATLAHDTDKIPVGKWVVASRRIGKITDPDSGEEVRATLMDLVPNRNTREGNEVADSIRDDFLGASSVSFLPVQEGAQKNRSGGSHYTSAKVTEVAVCAVPANQGATRQAALMCKKWKGSTKALTFYYLQALDGKYWDGDNFVSERGKATPFPSYENGYQMSVRVERTTGVSSKPVAVSQSELEGGKSKAFKPGDRVQLEDGRTGRIDEMESSGKNLVVVNLDNGGTVKVSALFLRAVGKSKAESSEEIALAGAQRAYDQALSALNTLSPDHPQYAEFQAVLERRARNLETARNNLRAVGKSKAGYSWYDYLLAVANSIGLVGSIATGNPIGIIATSMGLTTTLLKAELEEAFEQGLSPQEAARDLRGKAASKSIGRDAYVREQPDRSWGVVARDGDLIQTFPTREEAEATVGQLKGVMQNTYGQWIVVDAAGFIAAGPFTDRAEAERADAQLGDKTMKRKVFSRGDIVTAIGGGMMTNMATGKQEMTPGGADGKVLGSSDGKTVVLFDDGKSYRIEDRYLRADTFMKRKFWTRGKTAWVVKIAKTANGQYVENLTIPDQAGNAWKGPGYYVFDEQGVIAGPFSTEAEAVKQKADGQSIDDEMQAYLEQRGLDDVRVEDEEPKAEDGWVEEEMGEKSAVSYEGTFKGQHVYDMNPSSGELMAIIGPRTLAQQEITRFRENDAQMPSGFRWLEDDEWSQMQQGKSKSKRFAVLDSDGNEVEYFDTREEAGQYIEGEGGEYTVVEKVEPSDDIDPEKACEIMRDGEVDGVPLTEDQRGMFGAACARSRSMKGFKRCKACECISKTLEILISDEGSLAIYKLTGSNYQMTSRGGNPDVLTEEGVKLNESMSDSQIVKLVDRAWKRGYEGDASDLWVRVERKSKSLCPACTSAVRKRLVSKDAGGYHVVITNGKYAGQEGYMFGQSSAQPGKQVIVLNDRDETRIILGPDEYHKKSIHKQLDGNGPTGLRALRKWIKMIEDDVEDIEQAQVLDGAERALKALKQAKSKAYGDDGEDNADDGEGAVEKEDDDVTKDYRAAQQDGEWVVVDERGTYVDGPFKSQAEAAEAASEFNDNKSKRKEIQRIVQVQPGGQFYLEDSAGSGAGKMIGPFSSRAEANAAWKQREASFSHNGNGRHKRLSRAKQEQLNDAIEAVEDMASDDAVGKSRKLALRALANTLKELIDEPQTKVEDDPFAGASVEQEGQILDELKRLEINNRNLEHKFYQATGQRLNGKS